MKCESGLGEAYVVDWLTDGSGAIKKNDDEENYSLTARPLPPIPWLPHPSHPHPSHPQLSHRHPSPDPRHTTWAQPIPPIANNPDRDLDPDIDLTTWAQRRSPRARNPHSQSRGHKGPQPASYPPQQAFRPSNGHHRRPHYWPESGYWGKNSSTVYLGDEDKCGGKG